MLPVYDLVDFLPCLRGLVQYRLVVCVYCWAVGVCFGGLMYSGFCGLGLVWVLILGGVACILAGWRCWFACVLCGLVLDFGVMFCDLYIVVYCCVPGLCLSVAVCLLGVGGSV